MFCPASGKAWSRGVSPSGATVYFKTCSREGEKEEISPCECGHVWFKNCDENATLFSGFTQVFSDRAAMRLKSTALVEYFVYGILLNVSARKR